MPTDPNLPVIWTRSDASSIALSQNTVLVVDIPSNPQDLEGVVFTCFVIDPESETNSPISIASAASAFRYTTGE